MEELCRAEEEDRVRGDRGKPPPKRYLTEIRASVPSKC
nr:MAG TPA: hypothetical protein [Bacteriophage sp.]